MSVSVLLSVTCLSVGRPAGVLFVTLPDLKESYSFSSPLPSKKFSSMFPSLLVVFLWVFPLLPDPLPLVS